MKIDIIDCRGFVKTPPYRVTNNKQDISGRRETPCTRRQGVDLLQMKGETKCLNG